jgi:hypothetical protein
MDFDTVLFILFLSTANLIYVHENIRSRPSTWMVAAFLPGMSEVAILWQ